VGKHWKDHREISARRGKKRRADGMFGGNTAKNGKVRVMKVDPSPVEPVASIAERYRHFGHGAQR
jgi:hypothetical protein